MEQIIPSLAELLAPWRGCFRLEAFVTFQHVLVAWLLCPGRRTLTEVWQVCSLAPHRHYSAIYHLFRRARWDFDEIGRLLALLLITRLAPNGLVWLVVDDTLCHKRGQRVALAGMFLDPVLSSQRRKVFRYALNYVVLGLAFRLPFRADRYHCLPVLWRVFKKKGEAGHRKRTLLAAELACLVAELVPPRRVYLVADSAYVNATVLRELPANVELIGPLPLKAALHGLPGPRLAGQRGRQRKKGERLATPREMFLDTKTYPALTRRVRLPRGSKTLRVQEVKEVLWYGACKSRPVQVVLVRDESGAWPDVALLCTDVTLSATAVIGGYARRWSIEVTFHDSKQYLGLHDPQVRSARSVERAHPLAWLGYSLALLWYARHGASHEAPRRDRPWYGHAVRPAFAEVLGTLRLALWRGRYFQGVSDAGAPLSTAELLQSLLHCLATVR
jgi:DDE superfamily endonuclease